jgi:hypothetical protein
MIATIVRNLANPVQIVESLETLADPAVADCVDGDPRRASDESGARFSFSTAFHCHTIFRNADCASDVAM